MDRNVLLDGHAHAVIDAGAVRIEQKVLRIDRIDLHRDAILLNHADGGLSRLAGDGLSGRFKDFLGLDDDFADAGAVNLGHQLDLVDGLADFVLLEVLHELRLEHSHVQRVAVDVADVIGDVKKLALAEDRFHDLRVARLDGLLGGGRDDPRAFRVTNLVLCGPLTTENTLVFQPGVEVVGVAVVAPAVAVVDDESRQLFVVLRRLVELVLIHVRPLI